MAMCKEDIDELIKQLESDLDFLKDINRKLLKIDKDIADLEKRQAEYVSNENQ